jgi:hypothetical protein
MRINVGDHSFDTEGDSSRFTAPLVGWHSRTTPELKTPMARAKGVTPVSNFRIPPDLKAKAKEKAASEGRSLTDVIVDYLRKYTQGM